MKTKLLFLLCLFSLTDLMAQGLYVPGTVTKGKNATYYCQVDNKFVLKVSNIKNIDTTYTMYYIDGTVVPSEIELSGTINTQENDLFQVFREILTSEEWNILKSKNTYSLGLRVIADNEGNTQGIIFLIRNTDPVMTKLDPDRLYQLEQKLKKVLKMTPSKSDRSIRNIKYIQSINYRKMNQVIP